MMSPMLPPSGGGEAEPSGSRWRGRTERLACGGLGGVARQDHVAVLHAVHRGLGRWSRSPPRRTWRPSARPSGLHEHDDADHEGVVAKAQPSCHTARRRADGRCGTARSQSVRTGRAQHDRSLANRACPSSCLRSCLDSASSTCFQTLARRFAESRRDSRTLAAESAMPEGASRPRGCHPRHVLCDFVTARDVCVTVRDVRSRFVTWTAGPKNGRPVGRSAVAPDALAPAQPTVSYWML